LLHDHTILIDEISLIHPNAFQAANRIAQVVRQSDLPFGGLRLIVVGDFLQLPPVDPYGRKSQLLFEASLWQELDFVVIELTKSMRSQQEDFVKYLNQIRMGRLSKEVTDFLDLRVTDYDPEFEGTALVPRRNQAEAHKLSQLSRLRSDTVEIMTDVKIKKKGLNKRGTSFWLWPQSLSGFF